MNIRKNTLIIVNDGWDRAGRIGIALGAPVSVARQPWVPVLWNDAEDPDFIKAVAVKVLSVSTSELKEKVTP